ncbi:hypothetical protein [Rhodococcus phenolicus]|uniref:hypothetical protein n=1 Tax=Rhodococcus phenolicus TaxID=263849 RepID=UPI000836243F|nr:hypothetical protein [Rhodococcus phenolicus]
MTRRTTRRRTRLTSAAAAVTAAVALALPAVATADPVVPSEPAPAAEPSPAVASLSAVLDSLRGTAGVDPAAVAAAEAIAGARGGVTDVADANPVTAYQEAVDFLRKLGIEPFLYPTGAPFCNNESGLPLGIAPAVAGAVPGAWPNLHPVPALPALNAVDAGQTLFAFVPAGVVDGEDTTGMQVAWFNVNTLQGGTVPMGTIGEAAEAAVPGGVPDMLRPVVTEAIAQFFSSAVPLGGVRVAPVDTGSGTVLAAVFGTVTNGETSCFFLPTVGIVDVPAAPAG